MNEKIRKLISHMRVAMLTTVDEHGRFHSRPMAIEQKEFDGELWFFADAGSPKAGEIRANSLVSVTFAESEDQEYVALSGRAELVRDRKKAEELWSPIYKAWFPKGLEEPGLALLKVRVESAEFWTPGLVKALAANKRVDLAG